MRSFDEMKLGVAKPLRSVVLFAAVVVGVLIYSALRWVLPDLPARVLTGGRAGEAGFLSVHLFLWIFFFVGLGELWLRLASSRRRYRALAEGYLPDRAEDEKRVLTVDDMPDVYRKVRDAPTELAALIRRLALRFQAGRSVEQTHQLLDSELELWQYRVDLDYGFLRYVTWLIPTIGFIGTVVGISQALRFAGGGTVAADSAEFLPAVTARLAVAFDTTLVALGMSAVLVFLLHVVQDREERSLEASGAYCLDHLITRLYVR